MIAPKPFLVYKSSAGSGKTYNLAKVYLSLMLMSGDPGYFKRILAITFTVKAAAEMKDRILTYLSILAGNETRQRGDVQFMRADLVKETGLSEEQLAKRCAAILHEILHNYGDFNIVTIDKFFARLIRSFASDLSISPDFEIQVDEQQFIDRVLELFYDQIGQKEGLTDFVVQMTKNKLSDDQSGDADKEIAAACRNLLSDEFYFIRDKFKTFEPEQIIELKKELSAQEAHLRQTILAPSIQANALIDNAGLDAGDFYYGSKGIFGFFSNVISESFDKVLSPNSYVLATINQDKWQSGSKNPAVLTIKDQLEAKFGQIKALKPEIENLLLLQALQKEIYGLGVYSELDRLFKLVREDDNMRLLKEFNAIISDQLQYEQTPFIYERIGSQFKHILIDEFQDTSTLQWKNLLPLVENSLSEGNVSLVVGDAKQSIYRFRNSEPEQFVRLPEIDHPSAELIKSAYREIHLADNFRSDQNIVNFNKRFFEIVKEDYLSGDAKNTYTNHAQTAKRKEKGAVYWWISQDSECKNDDLILQMIDRVRLLIDVEGKSPGDICCLFRTNNDASKVASALLQSGFNVVSQESLLLKNNPQVQLIQATLKALASPKEAFNVQQWLSKASQHFQIPDLHLVAKSVKSQRLDFKSLLKHLKIQLTHPDLEHGDTFSRAMAICQELKIPLDNPFVAKYLDICLNFESSGAYLKRSFDEHWKINEAQASIQLTSSANAINVMTVHKSKGLEFPIVLFMLPAFSFKNKTKTSAWINISSPMDLGEVSVTLKHLEKTAFSELYQSENERSKLDFANIIYVAFTRAMHQLEVFSIKPAKDTLIAKVQEWPEWREDLSVMVIKD